LYKHTAFIPPDNLDTLKRTSLSTRKIIAFSIGILLLSLPIYLYLKPERETYTFYTIYQTDYKEKHKRMEIYALDHYNFTAVSYSGNGWQKIDSVIYRRKKDYTACFVYLAKYVRKTQNAVRFKQFKFEHAYRYYSKDLTVNRIMQNESCYQKLISEIKK
jgi:hypothetical protein